VTDLDVEALERGRVHRVFVELVHDGLGEPVRVPLLVGRGERPGPVLGIPAITLEIGSPQRFQRELVCRCSWGYGRSSATRGW